MGGKVGSAGFSYGEAPSEDFSFPRIVETPACRMFQPVRVIELENRVDQVNYLFGGDLLVMLILCSVVAFCLQKVA